MKPQCESILRVLRDGQIHRAAEWWDAKHGETIIAVSQRVSDINAIPGYCIRSTGKGKAAAYWLVSEPDSEGQPRMAVAM